MNSYQFPSINLLKETKASEKIQRYEYAKSLVDRFERTKDAYEIRASVEEYSFNPFSVMITIILDAGYSIRKLKNLRLDLELIFASPVEIITTTKFERGVVLAIKSIQRPIMPLREAIASDEFTNAESKLSVAAGLDLFGGPFVFDLAQTPNLLVAGTTGSGKSTFISDIIMSIIYKAKPSEVGMIMIDPKQVELGAYSGIPHLMMPVITETENALYALRWLQKESQARVIEFKAVNVKDRNEYVEKTGKKVPEIVVIIDEYMELMFHAPDEMEGLVRQISSDSRKSGIHMVLATQRPSKDVITPSIKSNIPCRASFTVVDKRESKIAVDRFGAERLLGYGDMLFTVRDEAEPVHAQAAYISYEEIDEIVSFLRKNKTNIYEETMNDYYKNFKKLGKRYDSYLEEVVKYVAQKTSVSISDLQFVFKIGYIRAGSIMRQLETIGAVAPNIGDSDRKVLISKRDVNAVMARLYM